MFKNIARSWGCPFAILFIIMLFVQSCTQPEPGVLVDDGIDTGLRNDFHKLNSELLDALKAGDAHQLENMLSKELLESHYLNRQAHLISLRMKKNTFDVLREYYVVHDKKGMRAINGSLNGDDYTLSYDALVREMYIAFMVPKNTADRWMLTAVYYKYSYGWKLFSLDFNPYVENGKTAPQLYRQAQNDYNKHYLVNAVSLAQMARDCSRPNEMWHYKVEGDMGMLLGKAMYEANQQYKFPYTIKQVPTHPQIFNITNKTVDDEGVYPMIYYISSIKFTDTEALKRENENVQKVIAEVFPGINQDKKFIYYTAYSGMPSYKEQTDSYEMVQKVK